MASMKNLPPCPDNLKPMLHYLKAAVEHDNRDPIVAYWLRYHAVQLGIKIDRASKPAKMFISGVMDQLEQSKKSLKGNEAITTDMVAQAQVENYALKLFSWADAEDRASHFDKNVVKAFYTAGLLFDVLDVWGDISEEIARQKKYAKWKAAYIHQCLKNGETPIPGPAANEEENQGNFEETLGTESHDQDHSMGNSQNNNSGGGAGAGGPSAYEKLFLPPGAPQGGFSSPPNQPVYPTFPPENPGAKPPNTLPVAPPRGNPKVQTPSPGTERHSGFINNPGGAQLTSNDIVLAQKNMKYASSALQFDDVATATDLLEKTLRLLKTGKE